MSTKVKICGLTNKDDSIWALNYGADYLGLNFYPQSPRHVSLSSLSWITELPSFASLIGVFVNAAHDDIFHVIKKIPLKGIQLHGNESPEEIQSLRFGCEAIQKKIFIVKAFRIKDEESLSALNPYLSVVDYLMLDAYSDDQLGGTGKVFNWDLALQVKSLNKPFFLAGGLTPENVGEAVKKVQPFAVDVASGVEKSVRKKDADKVKKFMTGAKSI